MAHRRVKLVDGLITLQGNHANLVPLRVVDIYISHKLPRIKIALHVEGGTSLKLVLNDDAEGAVHPAFDELTRLCKQWGSESEEFSGREVIAFVGVSVCSRVLFNLIGI